MLKSHMDAREQVLLATSKIPANTGHTLHKGTPREAFIKEFLIGHLSERVAVGSGEIIDANSRPGQKRNQIDIVIYRRDFPKLDFGGGVHGFLAESVVATIEVKSLLTKDDLQDAIQSARNVKSLQRHLVSSFSAGYVPPGILSYVVAYAGPANMKTVFSWIGSAHNSLGIVYPSIGKADRERQQFANPSLDGIFVLGTGFVMFDNAPITFVSQDIRNQGPDIYWLFADTPNGNLLLLFLLLTSAISGVSASWLNPLAYISDFELPVASIGVGV